MYYSELMQFAAREDFRNFVVGMVEDVRRAEYVQAVQIGIDEYWLEWFLFGWLRGRGAEEFPLQLGNANLSARTRELRLFEKYPAFDDEDLLPEFLSPKRNPPRWDSYCRSQGIAEISGPIYIKFLLDSAQTASNIRAHAVGGASTALRIPPAHRGSVTSGAVHTTTTSGARLRHHLQLYRECRHRRRLHPQSQSGDLYMVTCSHVVGQPGDEIMHPPSGRATDENWCRRAQIESDAFRLICLVHR